MSTRKPFRLISESSQKKPANGRWPKQKTRTCRQCKSVKALDRFEMGDRICSACQNGAGYSGFSATAEHYRELVEYVEARCAICHHVPDRHERRLSVDHDHSTGLIRGLLCFQCNWRLGVIEDSEWMKLALEYLSEKRPYEIQFRGRQPHLKKPQSQLAKRVAGRRPTNNDGAI